MIGSEICTKRSLRVIENYKIALKKTHSNITYTLRNKYNLYYDTFLTTKYTLATVYTIHSLSQMNLVKN